MGSSWNPAARSFAAFALCVILAGLGVSASGQGALTLVGTGSSLPTHLYSAWVQEYNQRNPKVQVRYLPIGTGESIKQVLNGSCDFGGGEAPISDEQLRTARVPVLQLPAALIGIVIIYNLPGVTEELNFTGPALAEIFTGKIKRWNDPQITKANRGVALPDLPIAVVVRTEGKGSSYMFSDYLSKVSPEFRAKIGVSPSPKWPVGVAMNGSDDMVGKVKSTVGAIGYTELIWAAKAGLPTGSVQSAAGQFVKPTAESIAQAVTASIHTIPNDFRISMTNARGRDVYPIISFSWLFVPKEAKDPERARALVDFLNWALTEGQGIAQRYGYPPIPRAMAAKVQTKLKSIR